MLMQELKTIEKEHPELITPDSPTQNAGSKTKREARTAVSHRVPMLSIQDVFTKEDVVEWVLNVKAMHQDAMFCVEQKIDGKCISLK